jgi:hypothetical protein
VILLQGIEQAHKQWATGLFDSVGTLFDSAAPAHQSYLAQEFHPDDVGIGHTYFLGRQPTVKARFAYQVYPLLREYYKDGVLLSQNGKIEFELPGGVVIDLTRLTGPGDLLSKLDVSWETGGST